MEIFIYGLFCFLVGVYNRFRGGALTTITGTNFGTTGARVLTGLMVSITAVLLLHLNFWSIPYLTVTWWIGDIISPWSQFERVNVPNDPAKIDKPSWISFILKYLPLKTDSVAFDIIGMSICGVSCVFPMALYFFHLHGLEHALFSLAFGLLYGPIYAIINKFNFGPFPASGTFAWGESWSEFFVGILSLGPAIIIGLS